MESEAAPSRKRPRVAAPPPEDFGGLYDFLPPPDPEKDAAAKAGVPRSRAELPPEDRTKVVFLDVDGVILPSGSVEMIVVDGVTLPVRETIKENDFMGAALENLRYIVQQTAARIVLSSEWRRSETLKSSIATVLKRHDLSFTEATPIFQPRAELQKASPVLAWCERRAREIGTWLKDHPEVIAWVAIDDLDFDMADGARIAGTPLVKYRSVQTHDRHCITDADAADAVQLLRNPPPEPKVKPKRPRVDSSGGPEEPSGVLCSTEDSGPERLRLG